MAKTMVGRMVDKFLAWPLPNDFAPDCYVTFDSRKAKDNNGWPIGTNLLTAQQAQTMIEHMLAGAIPEYAAATEEEGDAYTHGYFDGNEDVAVLRAALVGLIGADTEAELRQMEATMRILPALDADKAASINAIHALLATMGK